MHLVARWQNSIKLLCSFNNNSTILASKIFPSRLYSLATNMTVIKTLTGSKDDKFECKLIEKFIISPDTRKFRFALPSPNHVLGLQTGLHIMLQAEINGSLVVRPYSPVSDDDDHGYFDVVIKVYKSGVHPSFPEGGKLSQHLETLKLGDTITMKGPIGYMIYKGRGEFNIKKNLSGPFEIIKKCKNLGMLAGGTGITPMLQVAKHIMKDPEDKTVVSLLFSNHTEDDVLCKKELDDLAKQYPTRFKVWHTLTNKAKPPSPGWPYSVGYIDADMIKKHLPPPAPGETFIYLCGPPPFLKEGCHPALDKLGYSVDDRWPNF